MPASDRHHQLAVLRAQVGAAVSAGDRHGVLAFGVGELDGRLASAGLAAGGLHEFAGASTAPGDDAATTLFIAGVAARFAAASGSPALWAITRFNLYVPGLEQAGHAVRSWTPAAAVSPPNGLWLDLTGTTHLFGGEKRYCARVVAFRRRAGFTARNAVANAAGAARALARFGRDAVTIVTVGGTVAAVMTLPVASLRLKPAALRGRVQKKGEVIHVICERIVDRTDFLRQVGEMSFTHRTGRSDGVRHAGSPDRGDEGLQPNPRDCYWPPHAGGMDPEDVIRVKSHDFR